MGEGDIVETNGKSAPKKLTVEKIYQKKSQLEHILLRPDTYIGSVQPLTEKMWVLDSATDSIISREITYVPGLYKIFDEILVNAADNKVRDSKMDTIKIDIDPEKNEIKVFNNGRGIPVVHHKEEKMFVPTMIFGHLLTSSNFNDEEEKVTGGRNGYGAKLCNVFSTKFTVETACKDSKKEFKQSWAANMTKASEPKLKEYSGNDYTRITFYPDLPKFNMEKLDADTVALLSRRAYDVAASARGVKVYLNGKRVPIKGFKDYVDHFIKGHEDETGNQIKATYEQCGERWEVAVAVSDNGFQQMSFVNSIATTKGGRHIEHVSKLVENALQDTIKKKNKGGIIIKPHQIKNHLWVFVNCLIVNPTFDSQTKENMTLQVKQFGSSCKLSDKFVQSVSKSGVVESVLAWSKFKQEQQLKSKQTGKKTNKLKGIAKLEDANDAGTKNSLDCTLILTEGDSAKTLAVSGLGVVGRDKYGVYPLRGKLLNVREATHKQIMENKEINELVKIIGLQYKKKYQSVEDLKTLRYGRLMIMTDQDQDGSHIKGLLINFIHHNWPELLRLPFLEEFITPIVKATKGNDVRSFFSLPEFSEWKLSTENWHTWRIKYYKGLGTSTSKEAKEYFTDMARHRIKFKHNSDQDDFAITMAFSKKAVEQRKDWLTNWMEEGKRRKELGLSEVYLYEKDTKAVSYMDFINKELVLFSNLDNERSIPSIVDGFKPGQRKVMFTCLKRNDKREVKVAQLAGSVGEMSAYHHGEQSLMGTIINLAQNYVGSNNINLLQPIGQFGTRLTGGKDAASPRYIFTLMSPLARHIFNPHDDAILKYLTDDNQKIEPEWYMPIIPMVLVNGADGIGTGWMTKIPNYNPREIVENLIQMINGKDPKPMVPWFKNFTGTIEALGDQRYVVNGEVAEISETKVEITELPIRTWTQTYKEQVMEQMVNGSEKSPSLIQDYKEYHTDKTVRFVVQMTTDKMRTAYEKGLHQFFKLQTTMSTSSMVLFDHNGCMKKYEDEIDIMKEFFELRMEFYGLRKKHLEGILEAEALRLSNQARFILEKCDGSLVIENKKKKIMVQELIRKGFDPDPVKKWKAIQAKAAELLDEDSVEDSDEQEDSKDADYDYLLGMAMWCLTAEKKDELIRKKEEKQKELDELRRTSKEDMWRKDLREFLKKLDEVESKEREDDSNVAKKGTGNAKGGKKLHKDEIKPSPHGIRVAPKIPDELRTKIAKAVAAKDRKDGKIPSKRLSKDNVVEKDEFDMMAEDKDLNKSLVAKIGKAKSATSPKKKKKNVWESGSESGSEESDGLDDLVERRERDGIRRATAATKKYVETDDDDSESDIEKMHWTEAATEGRNTDDFDSLIGSSPSAKSSPEKPNVAPKRKIVDSDDEFNFDDDKDSDDDLQPAKKKPVLKKPNVETVEKKVATPKKPRAEKKQSEKAKGNGKKKNTWEESTDDEEKPKPAAKKVKNEKPVAKTSPKKPAQKKKKNSWESGSELDGDASDDEPAQKVERGGVRRAAATASKKFADFDMTDSDSDQEKKSWPVKEEKNGSDFDSLLANVPQERNPVKKAPVSKPKPLASKKPDSWAGSDEEDDFSIKSGDDSEDDYIPIKKKAAPKKAKTAAKKKEF